MKKLLAASVLSIALTAPALVNAADYTIDTKGAHASINFKVSHLGYSFIQGRFNKFDGQFSFDANNVEASKVTVNVDTQSLDSNHAERDKHIRSDDFINAGKFPTAKFVSSKVTKKADGGLAIDGLLTLHGQSKAITIDADFIGEGKDPWGGYRVGFQGTTRLQLADFGIPVMGASSYVDMNLHVEGVRK
ncbi:YceI family protein [Psychromonas ossibalaenae]|uniref:YceI family protein n=1 Tax=Psychromonas ossibalaenae TaxID=444922 RepID=UPI000367D585|nr:YceI family protein [Psychromonas ossibalaenae]